MTELKQIRTFEEALTVPKTGITGVSPRKIEYEVNNKTGCYTCTSHSCSKDGYPRIILSSTNLYGDTHCRRNNRIQRYLYYAMYGVSLDAGTHILMICKNRACINPAHWTVGIRPSTLSKLWDAAVLDIRDPNNQVKYLTEKYKITSATVQLVRLGKTWKHLPVLPEAEYLKARAKNRRASNTNTILTDNDVLEIRLSRLSTQKLADKYGKSEKYIKEILRWRRRKNSPGPTMIKHSAVEKLIRVLEFAASVQSDLRGSNLQYEIDIYALPQLFIWLNNHYMEQDGERKYDENKLEYIQKEDRNLAFKYAYEMLGNAAYEVVDNELYKEEE